MVSDTRSGRKNKENERNKSKNKPSDKGSSGSGSGKMDISSLRRSGRETKQVASSPRKSERLGKQSQPAPTPAPTPSPVAKRKSGVASEKQNTPSSSLRRSDRGKKHSPSSDKKEMKEKSMEELITESERVNTSGKENGETSGGMKRNRMAARSYRALFDNLKKRETTPEFNEELERPKKSSRVDIILSDDGDSELDGDNEPHGMVVPAGSTSSVEEASDADALGNDIEELPDTSANERVPGTCASCSRPIRLDYDSPEEELCSCAAILLDSGEGCSIPSVSERGNDEKMCTICKQVGEILICAGRGCKRCFHLNCLDPPLDDIPPKAWHCTWCVEKKIYCGVHSVTEGVESILDVREVEITGAKGAHRQKQYLVKYLGLAHVYNHWVAATQLPAFLLANYNHNNQDLRWNSEWRLPHRLLKKRSLIFSKLHGHGVGDTKKCLSEWLVKWKGLDYNSASWELENASFLNSQHGESLIKDFNTRREKAKRRVDKNDRDPSVELAGFSSGGPLVTDSNLLSIVNKLRECWLKCENAAVFDDQDHILKMVLFTLSLSDVCRPFLIITSSNSLSKWEAEFTRQAPSIDLVVYSGSRDSRRRIRSLEFYDEGGFVILQVLLSSTEAVIEDVEILTGLSWEVNIIDECQNSGTFSRAEQIKKFSTGVRVLLYNCPLKTASSESLDLLSLLDCKVGLDKTGGLVSDFNENMGKSNGRLSKLTSAPCTSKLESFSKFVEYWIPLQISYLQLEQYCSTLLKSFDALRSFCKSDHIGVLHNILLSLQKCCAHPYIADMSLQPYNKGHTPIEMLEIGIRASGKLQLLDKMLSQMKHKQLRVVVLFQSITDEASIPDILEDFLAQRYGKIFYERIETGTRPSTKQAAVTRFNEKESGCFVLLLATRACSPSVKLASVDSVIIYDSDTNPANDIRQLQKLSIDSQSERIKVFRPYSCFTVEERALILAKQDPHLDNNSSHSLSRNPNNTLMWGASNLFNRLDEYHSGDKSPNNSPVNTLLNDVVNEFSAIISDKGDTCSNPIISKVQMSMGTYSANIPLYGEKRIMELGFREEPHDVFWRKLLEGRNPPWRNLSAQTPRNRKRVQYFNESQNPHNNGNNDEAAKKRRKVVSHNVDAIPARPSFERGAHENDDIAREHVSRSPSRMLHEVEPAGRELYNEQKNLHIHLKKELAKLFQVLKLSEDVKHTVGTFLEYVMEKYRVPREPGTILQAFQISLCWIAASISKQKMDKEETFLLAKEHLQFGCTDKEAQTVYQKIRSLKRAYLQRLDLNDNSSSSSKCSTLAGTSQTVPNVNNETEERLQGKDIPIKDGNIVTEVKHRCEMRMSKLLQKQKDEIKDLRRKWEKEKLELEKQYEVQLSVVRFTYGNNTGLMKDREKVIETKRFRELQELNFQKDRRLKELERKHSVIKNKEIQKASFWLAKANSLIGHSLAGDEFYSLGSDIDNTIGFSQENVHDSLEIVSPHHVGESKAGNIDSTQCDTVTSVVVPASASNESNILLVESKVVLKNQATEELVGVVSVDVVSVAKSVPPNEDVAASTPDKLNTLPIETSNILETEEQVEIAATSKKDTLVVLEDHSEISNVVEELITENKNEENQRDSVISTDRNQISSEKLVVALPLVAPVPSDDDGGPLLQNQSTDHNGTLGHETPTQFEADAGTCGPNSSEIDNSKQQQPASDGRLLDPKGSITCQNYDDETNSIPNQGSSRHSDEETPLQAHVNSEEHPSVYVETLPPAETPVQVLVPSAETPVHVPGPATGTPVQLLGPTADPLVQHASLPSSNFSQVTNADPQPVAEECMNAGTPVQVPGPAAETLDQCALSLSPDLSEAVRVDSQPVSQQSVPAETPAQVPGPSAETPVQVRGPTDLPSREVVQPNADVGFLQGLSNMSVQMPTQNPNLPSNPDPLLKDWERMQKEKEQAAKFREDMKLHMRSECEQEIEKAIAEIRKKYDLKLLEVDGAFLQRRKEVDNFQNKVLMNKMLADAFRAKCMNLKPSGLPGMNQGMPSGMRQHQRQVSQQQSQLRSSPVTGLPSASQPSPTRASPVTVLSSASHPSSTRAAPVMGMPSACQSSSTRASPVSGLSSAGQTQAGQETPAPSMPIVSRALHSGGTSQPPLRCAPVTGLTSGAPVSRSTPPPSTGRPLVISAITPSMGNLRTGGEIRAPAPHLQPFRPPTSTSAAPSQPQVPSVPLTTVDLSSSRNTTSGQHDIGRAQSVPLSSARELLMNMESRAQALRSGANIDPPLPDVGTNFDALDLSEFQTLDNSGQRRSSSSPGVVCLSDDDN